MRRIRTLAAVAAVALSIGAGPASAAHIDGRPARGTVDPAAGAVTAISVVPGDGRAEVVIALTGPVQVADFAIEAPDRIVLDLTGARLNRLRAYDRQLRGGIRNIRLSQSTPSVVRIVLDLDAKRQYSVTQSDSEIRVSVMGGGRFVAWSTNPEKTVFAATPTEAPKTDPAANIATGTVATKPATAPAPAAAPAPVVPPPAAVSTPPARPTDIESVIAPSALVRPAAITTIGAFGSQQSQARRISITWEDAPIQDVLATFAEYSGRTIVRGKAVTGTVSAEIKDQPWDVAMKAILTRMAGRDGREFRHHRRRQLREHPRAAVQ
jgi:hypothetical protein